MTRIDLLRTAQLFAGCTEQDLVRLDGIAHDLEFDDGQPIFSHGDEANDLLIVTSGTIQLELPVAILGESKGIAFDTKKQGDVAGWSALSPPYRFTLSARADGLVRVAAFARTKINALFDDDNALGFRVIRNLTAIVGQRLNRTKAMWAHEVQRGLSERYR